MSGMSGSLLTSFYPSEALAVGISISSTGYVFGVRSTFSIDVDSIVLEQLVKVS